MSQKPSDFEKTVLMLADILKETQYAFRGTTSLVLQKIDMNVDDVDILCNRETALTCNDLLKEYLVEKVKYKESDKFKSYYGKFKVNNIQVEIMGEWQILDTKNRWSKPFDATKNQRTYATINNKKVFVTTIDTELKMFAFMGRWNAYHKIKRQVEKNEVNAQQSLL